jgi:hypothetical protein
MKKPTSLQLQIIGMINKNPERQDRDIAREAHTSGTYVGWVRRTYVRGEDVQRRITAFSKPGKENPVIYTRVLCLGPSTKVHYFMSPDKINVRICQQCKETIARISSGYFDEPCRIVNRGA